MKLSQLKILIASLEKHSAPGADPDIQFWLPRVEGFPAARPRDAQQFLQFDLDASDLGYLVWKHKIVAASPQVVQQKGDFTLPLSESPFYRA